MLAPIENVLKSLMTKSLPKGAVVIGDGLRRLVDRLEGCLAAFSPLPGQLVESVADVLKFDLKFVLKVEPKGRDDNDGAFGLEWSGEELGSENGSELGSRLERGRNMELEIECVPPSLKPLARLEEGAGCHLDAYKLRIFLSIAAISGADICLTLM